MEATRDTFQDLVSEGWSLVDVWGPSCAPCVALFPHIEEIARQSDELKVLKLEAPKQRRLCIDLKVHGLPTFLLFRDGEEVDRLSRPAITPDELRTWLKGAIV